MDMRRRPTTLWFLSIAAWFALPLTALNIAVHEKAPLLRALTLNQNWRILAFLGAWLALTSWWVSRARWAGFWSYGILAGVLLYGDAYLLLTTKNYGLAFFALGLLILSAFYLVHLYQALGMVYFHPGRAWHESLPRFVPKVTVWLPAADGKVRARLCRLGPEGCFIFTERAGMDPSEIELCVESDGERSVHCRVELVSRTRDGAGMGLMFKAQDPDQWKDLSDFIDRVRSYGYA